MPSISVIKMTKYQCIKGFKHDVYDVNSNVVNKIEVSKGDILNADESGVLMKDGIMITHRSTNFAMEHFRSIDDQDEVCDKCLKCHYYSDDVLEECQGQDKPCHEFSEGIAYRQWKLTGIANGWLEQEPHISGDLISRKALLKQFSISDSGSMIPEYDVDNFPITISIKDAKDIIRKAPTAFDKEKSD